MEQGGTKFLTASGVVGISGKPVRVFGYEQISGSGGPGHVILYNGTDATGNKYYEADGQANDSTTLNLGDNGLFFPAGLFVSLDTNVTSVAFSYIQAQS